MKTLADFKKLGVGTKVKTLQGIPKYQNVTRTIILKQTNAIKFDGGSWLEYPKASETTINGNTILIESRDKNGDIWNTLKYEVIEN